MPSALSETLTSSLSGLSAPRPSLAPNAVPGGFEDALRAADKPAPTPVAADRGTKPVKKDQDPPPSQAQDDSRDKKDKDQDSDTASATPAIPLVAVALAAPAAASTTPAATETADPAVPAVGAKAAVPAPAVSAAPATPQTATPAPQEGDQTASFTQVLADAAAAKTAGANAAATDSDAAGTGTTGGTATAQTAAGGAAANAAGATTAGTTGTTDAAVLANAGVSAVKGSLQPATADAAKTDAAAKPDNAAIPQAAAKPDTAAAKAEARNDAAKVAVDATAAKKDAAAEAARMDKPDDGQKLPGAPLPTADSGARTTQTTTATPAAQTANPGQAQAQAPVPLAAVPNEIAARAAKGATRFDIRLDPADLGRIDVHIDIDSDGRVTSRLFVERSETLALLKNDSRQLERSLQQAGFQTDPGSLQFSLRDSGAGNTGGNAFARQNWTPPTPSQPAGRAGMPDETPRTALYRSSSPASSGLDIRI